jgi:GNAT superfamily N-acetyltransferase
MGDFEIRVLEPQEYTEMADNVIHIAKWRSSYEVLDAFRLLDPNGFFGIRADGKLIGTISAVRYEENFGYIGYYFVHPDYRRRGLGTKLFQRAMAYLEGCNVGLTGVKDRVHEYQAHGFVEYAEDHRFVGKPAKLPLEDQNLQKFQDSLLDAVVEYDRTCFVSKRKRFLQDWFRVQGAYTYVYVQDDIVRGYATIHPIHQSWEIGPCFGDTKDIAKALIIALVNDLPPAATFGLNLTTENPEGMSLAREFSEYAFAPFLAMARMYTKGKPDIDSSKVWSPLSFSVG